MGLFLRAAPSAAPAPGDAFLVLDDVMTIRGVSRQAERLLRVDETSAVERHVGELLEGADEERDSAPGFVAAVRAALHGGPAAELALRPRDTHGVRWWARVAPCRPGPAAVVVILARL
jgi:PAS domain-containing protein